MHLLTWRGHSEGCPGSSAGVGGGLVHAGVVVFEMVAVCGGALDGGADSFGVKV